MSNALKFSGGSTKVYVRLGVGKDGRFFFAVEDFGVGIARADLSRVMEPFGQVEGYLSRKAEGTGLGLPLCKALTEAHGGEFRLTSTLGQGTCAEVFLPAERVVALDAAAVKGFD